MTITFVCRSSKVSKKDGLTPLELYVIINGKRRFISLNSRIDPKLFIIKNRLSDDDCVLFVDWLRMNHPSKMHHWLSHKRLVRMGE